MANAPSRTVLIAAIVLAGGVAVISNMLMQRMDPKEQERLEREAAAKATPVPSPAAAAVPAHAAPLAGIANENSLAALSGKTLGPETGKPNVEVRFQWTTAVQADPNKVLTVIQAIHQAIPSAKITVKNVDELPDETAGVFVEGTARIVPLPDGSFPAVPQQGIQAVIAGKPEK